MVGLRLAFRIICAASLALGEIVFNQFQAGLKIIFGNRS